MSIIGGFVVFSALADDSVISPVTTKDYVDNVISDKQPLSPITGTNKIMTYGATTGAQTAARDIIRALGNDTSAESVPTQGAVRTGLNTKQDAVIGTEDWVMTGSPYDGGYGGKPIYSATNNFENALVTAETVNNAAIAAANSEFSCETYVEGAEQIPDNCLIWRIHTDGPTTLPTPRTSVGDPTIPEISRCFRGLSETITDLNTCSANTLNYLGESGNKSGKWGTVFPYGDVMGISVCGTVPGSGGATDEQASILDSEYTAQAGTGVATGHVCWCQMTLPAKSKWVRVHDYTETDDCAPVCASECSRHIRINTAFRTYMFGSVENQ